MCLCLKCIENTCSESSEKFSFDLIAAPCINAQSFAFETTSFNVSSSIGNGMHVFKSGIFLIQLKEKETKTNYHSDLCDRIIIKIMRALKE